MAESRKLQDLLENRSEQDSIEALSEVLRRGALLEDLLQ